MATYMQEEGWFYMVLEISLEHDGGTIKRELPDVDSRRIVGQFMANVNHHTILYCTDSDPEEMRLLVAGLETKSDRANYHFLTLDEMDYSLYKGSDALVFVDSYHSGRVEPLFDSRCSIVIY